ncbi:MAG: FtsQ-type POTRA domain-containing protein [Spirochaetaceae bacterium]|jgi:cell division protein FtsQ|nr:FtsQ-type POTRA domain-containing protein [Spirochaetaceae bacterium]
MEYRAAMGYNAVMDENDPAGAEKKENFKFEKPLKRILIACSILLAGELLWLFVISPCMPLGTVDIKGLDGISRTVVLEHAGIDSRSSFMSVNAAMAEALLAIPAIEKVKVVKHFPDSIEIVITNRVPVAAGTADIGGRTFPVFFDKDGVLFQIGRGGGATEGAALPVISGLVFENIEPGLRLPEFLLPLFNELHTLRIDAPELLSTISEIQINKKKYDAYELTLYPVHNPARIRIGQHITEDKLRYMLLLLDVLNERGVALDELDFRTGTASYKVREM